MEGIRVGYVKASDDAASADKENRKNRRGIAGIYFAYKTAGAKAERGCSLEEVTAAAEKACGRISTIGFALSPCRFPEEHPRYSIWMTMRWSLAWEFTASRGSPEQN